MNGTNEIENTDTVNSDEGQLVVFKLSKEEFGVDINNVREIVRLPDITPIPCSPEYISGICNLRGNVLPVIDSRIRFAMKAQEMTDKTRLLVVEAGGCNTGLVVDDVREVLRIKLSHVEPPPVVCRGIDRGFLSGVVKMDEGKRLILTLNLGEVVHVEVEDHAQKTTGKKAESHEEKKSGELADEEQLVTFNIAKEEYAFNIDKVREILRVSEITAVPNVPSYVRGLFTIRNQLMPVLDLRSILGVANLASERCVVIEGIAEEIKRWGKSLSDSLMTGGHFPYTTDTKASPFIKWLDGYDTSSSDIQTILKSLRKEINALYSMAAVALAEAGGRGNGEMLYKKEINPLLEDILKTFNELRGSMEANITADQRIIVVGTNSMNIGYLVDSVNEVMRIPHSVIDATPALATSEKSELKGVAKLDEGKRLIMIMNESALVSGEESRMLADMTNKAGSDRKADASASAANSVIDEEQLVTFTIKNEEYGLRIMQVQEINRLSSITDVPRAPQFIDGLTNLRGNVIPVVNVRSLFGLEKAEVDDRTRIIIVDIGGNKTGLRVDEVKEVLRLSRSSIEETPTIVTSTGANHYMDGICKIDNGKRMVVLLNVDKILNDNELKTLSKVSDGGDLEEEVTEAVSGQLQMKRKVARKSH
jgi:purine-binding chemotaxis protein CheW